MLFQLFNCCDLIVSFIEEFYLICQLKHLDEQLGGLLLVEWRYFYPFGVVQVSFLLFFTYFLLDHDDFDCVLPTCQLVDEFMNRFHHFLIDTFSILQYD